MEEKINKIYKLVIILLLVVGVNLILTIVLLSNNKSSKTNASENTATKESSDYDVSLFDALTLDGILKLFDNKKSTYVVYFGRSTCSACKTFLPVLQTMQKKYEYTTKYLDITTVDASSSSYEKLMEKLNTKVTLNVSGQSETKTFGEFFGYTPMTFIIKNGKFAKGIVGAYSEEKFEQFLNENGIK